MLSKFQHIARITLVAACVTACSNSHDSGSGDAGTDAVVPVDATPTDMRDRLDAPWSGDACIALSCNPVCELGGGTYCDSEHSVASACNGACPDGYSSMCESFAPSCLFVGDGGVADSGGPDITACEYNADCVVVSESCCGVCGNASRTDMTAVNSAHLTEHFDSVCEGGIGCPACAGEPDRNLVAECVSNHCVARDLRTAPVEACEQNSDCTIRVAACCECGAEATGPYIAVNASLEGEYEALVCDPRAGACSPGPCATYPAQPAPTCILDSTSGNHHCELVFGAD